MSSLNNRQSGFGAVAMLMIIFAVLIIGVIGLIVSNKHTQTAPAKAANTTSPAPKAPTTPITPNPATPTTAGATLTVKEWGVQIPLPDSLKDAYYVPSTGSAEPDGSINTIWLGLKSKDTTTCSATLGNTGGSVIAGIVRVLPTDVEPVSGDLYMNQLPNGAMIGKYYYGYLQQNNPNNKCGSVASRSDINAAFGSSTKRAKPADAVSETN